MARTPKAKPKIIRPLFSAASALSLLLCLGTVALWLRTSRQEEIFQWVGQTEKINPGRRMGGGEGGPWLMHAERVEWRVLAGRGRIWLFRFEYWFAEAPTDKSFPFDYAPPPGAGFRRTRPPVPAFWFDDSFYDRWFDFENDSNRSRVLSSHVLFPLALPAATTAILPLLWLALSLRRSIRRRKG